MKRKKETVGYQTKHLRHWCAVFSISYAYRKILKTVTIQQLFSLVSYLGTACLLLLINFSNTPNTESICHSKFIST